MKCSETDCSAEATHAPKLCIPAEGYPIEERRALQMILGVELCRAHAEAFKPEQLLDAPNEKGATLRDAMPIFARVQGSRVPPDCNRAWIKPIPLDGDEYRDFVRIQAKSADPAFADRGGVTLAELDADRARKRGEIQ